MLPGIAEVRVLCGSDGDQSSTNISLDSYLSICLSVCLSIYLSIYLSIFLHKTIISHFTYLSQFPLSSLLLLTPPFHHPTPNHSSERISFPMWSQHSVTHLSEAGQRLSPKQGIPPKSMYSRKVIRTLGINPSPTANGHTDCPKHMTVTHIQRA